MQKSVLMLCSEVKAAETGASHKGYCFQFAHSDIEREFCRCLIDSECEILHLLYKNNGNFIVLYVTGYEIRLEKSLELRQFCWHVYVTTSMTCAFQNLLTSSATDLHGLD